VAPRITKVRLPAAATTIQQPPAPELPLAA